ncbi:hypothetical protein THAPSDRAFT_34973 [Thalassiosira pseudonana CCMP1335]|uniref:Uncharacterized protein n=1 Tax=Thalassiosira pseudonana TaxID=35128 RepID=B8C5L7_THAPS|nr:hypothetical protein THAPSDRAFT_34973 [Thalassiosira pseudonana CCMP1335]EED91528.1 hypothetical protein THAPSDRAFT_34973 [Thalassiosira pseudonana CCMP1335]
MKHLRCGGSIPKKHLTNGVADYVAQEEMDRHTGFWWHPSSNGILFTRVDESMVPPYRIIHNARSSSLTVYEEHRYPYAGKLNPSIQLGYRYSILNWSLVKWFNPPPRASEYLARVLWLPDGSACAHWQNRTQTLLEVIRIDIETGEQNRLLSERSNIWINLHDMFVSLPYSNSTLPPGSFSFIYASERTNWCHLYLYTYIGGSREGAILLRTLSEGSWVVESIAGVDIERDIVYVTGTHDSPIEKHLYALPITNSHRRSSRPIRLTKERGIHDCNFDAKCRVLVDSCSDIDRPPSTKLVFVLHDRKIKEATNESGNISQEAIPKFAPPKPMTFHSSDLTTALHGVIYIPDPSVYGQGPYPLICSVYGGPNVQSVSRNWLTMTADIRAQRLRSLGFVVLKCDNRGSSRRGLHFEGAIKGRLGHVEVQDQIAAVKELVSLGIADESRVGIIGWSYGGYLAAMCLGVAPKIFRCGVAGAPVTDWMQYDTHYTERYLGLPGDNATGYEASSVFPIVEQMRGKLLLVHGMLDENVHIQHTTRLIKHLAAAGKVYDLILFPNERHSTRQICNRVFLESTICDYFVKNVMKG